MESVGVCNIKSQNIAGY